MRCSDSDRIPLLLCPYHTNTNGGQNQPRNRKPLMQCCMLDKLNLRQSAVVQNEDMDVKLYQDNIRHSQLMFRNIQIPSSYYTSTDPRYLPPDVIQRLRLVPSNNNNVQKAQGELQQKLVTLSRSSSNVSVRKAAHVKIPTSKHVSRSQSFSGHRPQTRVTGHSKDPRDRTRVPALHTTKLSATLSQHTLPWEYKIAGIGSCWQGKKACDS